MQNSANFNAKIIDDLKKRGKLMSYSCVHATRMFIPKKKEKKRQNILSSTPSSHSFSVTFNFVCANMKAQKCLSSLRT